MVCTCSCHILLTSSFVPAENHFSTDYPEDEVNSDDEYGRMAYAYRTENASDEEEYGRYFDADDDDDDDKCDDDDDRRDYYDDDYDDLDEGHSLKASDAQYEDDLSTVMAKIRRFNLRHRQGDVI